MLRNDLGYTGVIASDDFGMGAITRTYALPRAGVKALQVGTDCSLVCGGEEACDAMVAAIKEAVGAGRITEKRLDESVARILRLKQGLKTVP